MPGSTTKVFPVPGPSILIGLAALLLAVLIYRPILKQAGEDMAARSRAGLSNGIVYALILLPLLGPLIYLAIRKSLVPKE
jgi:hypothetical protein